MMLSGRKSKVVFMFPQKMLLQDNEVVLIKFIASCKEQLDALRAGIPCAQGDEQAYRAKSFGTCYVVIYCVRPILSRALFEEIFCRASRQVQYI